MSLPATATGTVEVVAHRGASAAAPEHTLAAYERALADGADALECDVRLTADGHVVCVHDRRINRTSNGAGVVSTKTLAELHSIDFGSWKATGGGSLDGDEVVIDESRSRVLTLDRLLKLVSDCGRDVGLAVETKHPTRYAGLVEQRVVDALRRVRVRPGRRRNASTTRCSTSPAYRVGCLVSTATTSRPPQDELEQPVEGQHPAARLVDHDPSPSSDPPPVAFQAAKSIKLGQGLGAVAGPVDASVVHAGDVAVRGQPDVALERVRTVGEARSYAASVCSGTAALAPRCATTSTVPGRRHGQPRTAMASLTQAVRSAEARRRASRQSARLPLRAEAQAERGRQRRRGDERGELAAATDAESQLGGSRPRSVAQADPPVYPALDEPGVDGLIGDEAGDTTARATATARGPGRRRRRAHRPGTEDQPPHEVVVGREDDRQRHENRADEEQERLVR